MIKYRYQNLKFKKNLDQARHYKRKLNAIPSSKGEIFLSKIGLKSWLSKTTALIILAAIFYFWFFPNIFTIKSVKVVGLKEAENIQISDSVLKQLKKKSFFPQNNLFLLSTDSLKSSLPNQSLNIAKVESIQKNYPNSLKIELKSRLARYLLSANNANFLVSKDGIVMRTAGLSEVLPSNLVLLDKSHLNDIVAGQTVLTKQQSDLMEKINQTLTVLGLNAQKYSLNGEDSLDLEVYLKQGFGLKIDTTANWDDVFKNLQALFTKIPLNAKLTYIDLRVPDRAYVCYKNTLCDQKDKSPTVAGTSTPSAEELKIKN